MAVETGDLIRVDVLQDDDPNIQTFIDAFREDYEPNILYVESTLDEIDALEEKLGIDGEAKPKGELEVRSHNGQIKDQEQITQISQEIKLTGDVRNAERGLDRDDWQTGHMGTSDLPKKI